MRPTFSSLNVLCRWLLALTLAHIIGNPALADSNGRVRIQSNEYGKRVVRADGSLLRGTSVMTNKYQRDTGATRYFYSPDYWDNLTGSGINAIRIAVFDPWQRAHGDAGSTTPYPHTDWTNLQDRAEMIYELDYLVDAAEEHGMTALINYHNTGGYRDPDHSKPANEKGEFQYLETMDEVIRFWEFVAARYANREHVFYEPLNEYARWHPDNYTDEILEDTHRLFRVVRRAAPETHIVLLSFANHIPSKPDEQSMRTAADRLEELGVDFSNASVAFHPYNPHPDKPNPQKYILELMAEYPVINTEQNFPVKSIRELDWLDAGGLEGDYFGVQSMERLGISWFHWNIETPHKFSEYYQKKLVPDAKSKGYFWFAIESSAR